MVLVRYVFVITGRDMFESTYIIAKKQSNKARELLNIPTENQIRLSGSVRSVFQWIDMTKRVFVINNQSDPLSLVVSTCAAALGYAFAAGTTDGPGLLSFTQGANTTSPFWKFVKYVFAKKCTSINNKSRT